MSKLPFQKIRIPPPHTLLSHSERTLFCSANTGTWSGRLNSFYRCSLLLRKLENQHTPYTRCYYCISHTETERHTRSSRKVDILTHKTCRFRILYTRICVFILLPPRQNSVSCSLLKRPQLKCPPLILLFDTILAEGPKLWWLIQGTLT